jgi:hypothetical protein
LISNRYQDRLEMQCPGIGRKPPTGSGARAPVESTGLPKPEIPVRGPNRERVALQFRFSRRL